MQVSKRQTVWLCWGGTVASGVLYCVIHTYLSSAQQPKRPLTKGAVEDASFGQHALELDSVDVHHFIRRLSANNTATSAMRVLQQTVPHMYAAAPSLMYPCLHHGAFEHHSPLVGGGGSFRHNDPSKGGQQELNGMPRHVGVSCHIHLKTRNTTKQAPTCETHAHIPPSSVPCA